MLICHLIEDVPIVVLDEAENDLEDSLALHDVLGGQRFSTQRREPRQQDGTTWSAETQRCPSAAVPSWVTSEHDLRTGPRPAFDERQPWNHGGQFVNFMRMSASVYANHDPQPSDPNQVMVIMFSVELGAVDESHRHLKPFMKGRGLLQFR